MANALSPAKVTSAFVIDEATKAVRALVPDYQLSLAIGKEGQNARLAAKLTGARIDIQPDSDPGVLTRGLQWTRREPASGAVNATHDPHCAGSWLGTARSSRMFPQRCRGAARGFIPRTSAWHRLIVAGHSPEHSACKTNPVKNNAVEAETTNGQLMSGSK